LEAALKQYERAGQLAPEDAEAPLGQGRVLAAMGKREEAVAAFEKAVTLDPSLKAELAPEIERLRNGKGPQGGKP
jgi:tetratricopeptide (TPR) repeat protein